MEELILINSMAYFMIISAFAVLTYTSCGRKIPYGRYNQAERPFMSIQVYLYANRAWVIQELPSLSLFFYYTFFTNGQQLSHLPNQLIMLGLLVHYFHRYRSQSIILLTQLHPVKTLILCPFPEMMTKIEIP